MIRLDLKFNGQNYTQFTAQELAEAGVPQAVIAAAVEDIRRGEIKAECSRRIYGIASQATQTNMNAMTAIISGKTATSRSDAEKAVLAAMEIAIGWVAAMRAQVGVLAADATIDYRADASWPACPPAVIALVAQF